jgi:hypothetical protein
MITETIKEIKDMPDYYVSDYGTIYTTKISHRYNPNGEMRVLRPRIHPSGYLYVGCFVGEGKTKQRLWRRVHRVVYETHIGNIPEGHEIDHISGDKHNNDISNLRAVTRSENMRAMHERKKNKTKLNEMD